jgi:hypothetical protein
VRNQLKTKHLIPNQEEETRIRGWRQRAGMRNW